MTDTKASPEETHLFAFVIVSLFGHDTRAPAYTPSLSARPSRASMGVRLNQRYCGDICEASYIHSQVLLRRPWSKFHPDCVQQDRIL